MAKITSGIWTTHGPQLNTSAEEWMLRVPADKSAQHWFKGKQYSFDELVELRKDEDLAFKSSLEEREKNAQRCQDAIEKMADFWEANRPDVTVIFGNDQRELIMASVQPMFSVYHGETFWQDPVNPKLAEHAPPGIFEASWANHPEGERADWPGDPELAGHIIASAVEEGFDVGTMASWPNTPPRHHHTGTPHAFAWVVRRVMRDNPSPIVPIFTNTFWEPNQPTAKRCFEFGEFIGRAIESWGSDKKVCVMGSGGLTHFAIEESLDAKFIDAIQSRDAEALKAVPQNVLHDGTSELRNWIGAAGAAFTSDISGDMIDYVPCYRTEAGTGTAQGFLCWS